MGKKSGSGSGMNNQDHISESLEKIFGVKILTFFDADPGWKKFGSGIWDGKKFGSRINIPDPQHWFNS
jgi:hypothetical protein